MSEDIKKVPFKWEFGEETVSLNVSSYANTGGIYIGVTNHGEDGPEPFADMTINLPAYSLEPNEAFICGDISRDMLNFIKENKLGKVLPIEGKSGYGTYKAIAFNMEKLKEFDPEGVAAFMKEHDIPEKKTPTKNKRKSRGMDR